MRWGREAKRATRDEVGWGSRVGRGGEGGKGWDEEAGAWESPHQRFPRPRVFSHGVTLAGSDVGGEEMRGNDGREMMKIIRGTVGENGGIL